MDNVLFLFPCFKLMLKNFITFSYYCQINASLLHSPSPNTAAPPPPTSPCYVDSTVNLDLVVRRVLWGKLTNLGQICIAPDYLLSSKAVQEQFVSKVREVLLEWYGREPQKSPDLSRIVNERHVE